MEIANQLSLPGVPRVIGPAKHAMLDYGVAATFFALGMRYRDRNPAASTFAFANGALVLGMSLLTDYPGGVARAISFKTHGAMDVAQAALAGLGPMLFGFAHTDEAKTFYAQALSEVGVIAATDWNAPVV